MADPFGTVTPETFGAIGHGVTNDSDAFAAVSDWLAMHSGGTVVLRAGATYLVGKQAPSTSDGAPTVQNAWSYQPQPLIRCVDATKPIILQGNGACLKCASGLRYGGYTPTGEKGNEGQPNVGRASPYEAMLYFDSCTSTIRISDIELDGSSADLLVGGTWGDTGRQIPACGILMVNVQGLVHVENVYAHDHAWDGWLLNHSGAAAPGNDTRNVTAVNVVLERNARQALSLTGGRGLTFTNCSFNRSGTVRNDDLGGPLVSAPGAGIDMECEYGQHLRGVTYDGCEIVGNAGAGVLAFVPECVPNQTTAQCYDFKKTGGDITYRSCFIVGTSREAVYNNFFRTRFYDCTIVGQVVYPWNDPTGLDGTYFEGCLFTDDPALSPTGVVYAAGAGLPLVDHYYRDGTRYNRCTFHAVNGYRLPATLGNTRFHDIVADSTSGGGHFMRGHYSGTCVVALPAGSFEGPYNDDGSGSVSGTLVLNGVRQAEGTFVDPGSVVAAQTVLSRDVTVPFLRAGNGVVASVNGDLGDLVVSAQYRSANVATVKIANDTGASITMPRTTFAVRIAS